MRYVVLLSVFIVSCASEPVIEPQVNGYTYHAESNWFVNFDSIRTVEEYMIEYRQFERNKSIQAWPFIVTDSGDSISLKPIRHARGGGYQTDPCSIFRIFTNSSNHCTVQWCVYGTNYSEMRVSLDKLNDEIRRFYLSNMEINQIGLFEIDTKEIWVTPLDEKTNQCDAIIAQAALSYASLIDQLSKSEIPFSVVIAPRNDPNRLGRIVRTELDKG